MVPRKTLSSMAEIHSAMKGGPITATEKFFLEQSISNSPLELMFPLADISPVIFIPLSFVSNFVEIN